MQLYTKATKEVEQSESGSHIGAFFDFDGTIIYGYSATTYLREQIRRGDVKLGNLAGIVASITKFGLGNIGFSAFMSETSQFVKGIEENEYIEFGENLYKKHIAKLVYPESRALIEAHLKKGHTVALISAATPYQVMPAARDLHIKNVVCSHLEVKDGVFTGNVMKPTCYGMGKVVAAQGLEEKFGVKPEESFFYSDSDEDIDLLEYVGKPRPLNPNTNLRRIANGRGWPVQDFTSRGSVGIRDYMRAFAVQGSMLGSFMAAIPIYALTRSVKKSRNFSTALFADVACAIAGIEIDVTGEENLWSSRPCVFVFNHQSQVDTIIMPALLRRDMAGVGKKEIGDVPILGKLMQIGGTVLIDRENSASAVEALKPLVDVMRKEGRSVCIAPEGTRSTSTNVGRFKKGAFHLAQQAGVPVVPVVIHNANDVSPKGQFVMRPATVKVTVLPPIDTSDWTPETMGEHTKEVRNMFLEELDQVVLQSNDSPIMASQSPKHSPRLYVKKAKKKVAKKPVTLSTSPRASLNMAKIADQAVKAGKAKTSSAKKRVSKATNKVRKATSKATSAAGKALPKSRARRKAIVKISAREAEAKALEEQQAAKVTKKKATKKKSTKKKAVKKKMVKKTKALGKKVSKKTVTKRSSKRRKT